MPQNYYHLLKSYIEDRKFFIEHNGETSSLYAIHCGVPQGSVLGPILYLLYTADIPKPSNTLMIATFADYTVLLSSHKNVKAAVENFQQTVDALMRTHFSGLKCGT